MAQQPNGQDNNNPYVFNVKKNPLLGSKGQAENDITNLSNEPYQPIIGGGKTDEIEPEDEEEKSFANNFKNKLNLDFNEGGDKCDRIDLEEDKYEVDEESNFDSNMDERNFRMPY